MDIISKFFLGLEQLKFSDLFLALLSILPWGFILFLLHPGKLNRKLKIIIFSLIMGYISTRLILYLHPIIWPEIDFKPRKTSMLTATAHLAFIQAGMMEETFKILLIFLLAFFFGYDYQNKIWKKDVVLIGGFVALGFAFTENYSYIHKEIRNTFQMFTGRLLYSSNIHLLINLCFALFLLKSNDLKLNSEKIELYFKAFLLAVFQHGVVDFFLIPASRFGIWLSVAMFMGIWVWVLRDLRNYVYYSEEINFSPKQLPLLDYESGNLTETGLS
jgi:RsiW-degrading membrane proteinase PrsW (M82 family)